MCWFLFASARTTAVTRWPWANAPACLFPGAAQSTAEVAINTGATGRMLRAAGVNYDLRKVDKYGIYDRFEFKMPLGDHGDTYDRYMSRVLEMRESVKILQQALKQIPAGPIIDPKAKL